MHAWLAGLDDLCSLFFFSFLGNLIPPSTEERTGNSGSQFVFFFTKVYKTYDNVEFDMNMGYGEV